MRGGRGEPAGRCYTPREVTVSKQETPKTTGLAERFAQRLTAWTGSTAAFITALTIIVIGVSVVALSVSALG